MHHLSIPTPMRRSRPVGRSNSPNMTRFPCFFLITFVCKNQIKLKIMQHILKRHEKKFPCFPFLLGGRPPVGAARCRPLQPGVQRAHGAACVGLLLGSNKADKTLDVANSFASQFFAVNFVLWKKFTKGKISKKSYKTKKISIHWTTIFLSLIWFLLILPL